MDEESIFHLALEKAGSDRAAFLAENCAGDAECRRRVEVLLEAHDNTHGFLLDVPPADLNVAIEPVSERPGAIIGPYKLLQQIGEGGMGVVFMAEQSAPIQRTVALKIIKPGMDTRQVIARFEAERQAVAMMDHPNIAKVLDAGTTDTGRPYFVMELVKGVPITKYCDDKHLPVRTRLELFIQVCQAVQHAHQKGIIHRDIKPNNALVAEYDNQAIPKVIDFGVAKATAHRLTERTMFTEFGQVLGTVEYMSPEQAKLNQLDIDTRSDIYSLGVMLYELLAGSTPFAGKRLHEAAFDEMLRIIREEEPPKPSTRLTASDALPLIANLRNTEPARLGRDVRGELDWIVMKSLEKDRNRRYETANGLATDVQRYLHDEAVLACPPSAGYRFRKFARRHRMGLLATAACFVALLVLVAVLAITNHAISRERDQKAAAFREAEAQRQRSEKNFLKVRMAVRSLIAQPAAGMGEWAQLPAPLRRNFFEEAAKYYESLLEEGSDDPTLRYETAVGYRSIGFLHHQLYEHQQAEKLLRQSIAILAPLVNEQPNAQQYRHQLAWSNVVLAWTLRDTARPEEAKRSIQTATELYEQLLLEKPDNSDYDLELSAKCYPALNTLPDNATTRPTERLCQRGLQLLAKLDPTQAPFLRRTIGQMLLQLGRPKEAEKLLREARVGFETCKALDVEIRTGKATAYHYLIKALARQGRTEEVRAIHKKEIADLSDDPDGQATLVNYSLVAANALIDATRWDEAIQLLNEATAALPVKAAEELAFLDFARQETKAAEKFSQAIELAPDRWEGWSGRAFSRFHRRQWEPAIADFTKAIELDPHGHSSYFHRGHAYMNLDEWDTAAADFRKATEISPSHTDSWYQRAVAHAQLREPAEALTYLRRAVAQDARYAQWMKTEARLEPIRASGEFKKLLAELEEKQE